MMLYNISNIVLLQPSFQNLMNFQQMMPINQIQMVQIYLSQAKIQNGYYIFFIDRSCSMSGIRIQKANNH
ncbi:unnamed protein product [Paramecium pentaurelia]|uniref:Uncharacterized protein n=1 Tax=Paramecium pentaurelia TaxID=43138 RepID=A0A8S1YRP3_9CILI|nr:unnamed protein product [Paramecium pentaurelia]